MDQEKIPTCGVIMPISALDGCSEGHWAEVLSIITESVETAGFSANIVSNADDVGLIHKRIIQNLYDNPIVVCDISGKNPNVMFELGMRLAFDKPTIVIKDDTTNYSFDTSPIEHLEYPRDLRFSRIVEFKKYLSAKIEATYKNSVNDPEYTTFLKYFGEFKVAKIDEREVPQQEIMMEQIAELRRSMHRLTRVVEGGVSIKRNRDYCLNHSKNSICLKGISDQNCIALLSLAQKNDSVHSASFVDVGEHKHLNFVIEPSNADEFESINMLLRRNLAMLT